MNAPTPPPGTSPGSSPANTPGARRTYKYYDLLLGAFVTVLLCSNMIGPGKSCVAHLPIIGTVVFGAGNIFFPFSYIFDDVLTEVYGYARSRRAIWAGFGSMLFYVLMAQVVINLPADDKEPYNKIIQPAIEVCFGAAPRIVVASLLAFWLGDFVNSYIMAKMKIWTKGRHLWSRTIGSTIAGEGVDSIVFYPLAFASFAPLAKLIGMNPEALPTMFQKGWTAQTLMGVITFNWFFKVMMEVILTPVTYLVINFLKRAENEDYYDRGTNFTPFTLKD